MTVSSTSPRVEYPGASTDDTFEYTWLIEDESHLSVYVVSSAGVTSPLTITDHYTVDDVGETSGGTITLVSGGFAWQDTDGDLKTGYDLVIEGAVPISQTSAFRNQSSGKPKSYEEQFDRCVRIDKQQQVDISRSLRAPVGEASIGRLPTAADRASGVLGFDASGNPIVYAGALPGATTVSAFGATLVDDADAGTAQTTLGFSTYFKTLVAAATASTLRTLLGGTAGVFTETMGGTAQAAYTTGQMLYASATNVLSKLSIGTTNQLLTVIGGIPAWRTTPTCYAYRATSDQTGINPNNSDVQIFFNSVTADSQRGFDSASGFDTTNGYYTVQRATKVFVRLQLLISGTNVLANAYRACIRTGTGSFAAATVAISGTFVNATAGGTLAVDVSGIINVTPGDRIYTSLHGNGNNSASTLTMAFASSNHRNFLSVMEIPGT